MGIRHYTLITPSEAQSTLENIISFSTQLWFETVTKQSQKEEMSSIAWNWSKLGIVIQLNGFVWASALVWFLGRAGWIVFRIALYLRNRADTIK